MNPASPKFSFAADSAYGKEYGILSVFKHLDHNVFSPRVDSGINISFAEMFPSPQHGELPQYHTP